MLGVTGFAAREQFVVFRKRVLKKLRCIKTEERKENRGTEEVFQVTTHSQVKQAVIIEEFVFLSVKFICRAGNAHVTGVLGQGLPIEGGHTAAVMSLCLVVLMVREEGVKIVRNGNQDEPIAVYFVAVKGGSIVHKEHIRVRLPTEQGAHVLLVRRGRHFQLRKRRLRRTEGLLEKTVTHVLQVCHPETLMPTRYQSRANDILKNFIYPKSGESRCFVIGRIELLSHKATLLRRQNVTLSQRSVERKAKLS